MATHRPPQQASPDAQSSPSTRQPASSWQVATPLSSGAGQVRPQHSSAFRHTSPAGRHSGSFVHIPIMQTPLQQSAPIAHVPPVGAQVALAQTPSAQPRLQQAPAWLQV